MAPITLRFKRKDTTAFLLVESGDSFRKIKTRLADCMNVKGGMDNVKLFAEDKEKEYLDEALVSDFALTDESVVYVALNGENIS
jgi:hypothetical protein